MKSGCILFFLTAVLCVTGVSQVRFGATAGLNFSNFGGSDSKIAGSYSSQGATVTMEGPNTRTGYAVGMFLNFPMKEHLTFAPGMLYSMKGAKYNFTANVSGYNVTGDVTMKYDYVEIPLIFKFSFPTEFDYHPVFLAGPSLGILISSKTEATASGGGSSSSSESAINNQSGLDLGLVFGAGIDFPISEKTLEIAAMYGFGLNSVDSSPGGSADIKNNYIGIRAGVIF